jgi:hypothetical protein
MANADQLYKKSSAVVGHPPVTDHNIDDDYVKDPPHVSHQNFRTTPEVR